MSVKTAYRTFFLPEWGGSVLKKRAAAWFTMRSWGLGVHPNKRPMAVIGHPRIACPFLFDIFMDLIKRPTPWFSFINPMIYNELRHYSTMFSQVSGSIPPPSSTDSRLMVILWLKPAFSSTVWMVGESHTGVSSQNRAL